MSDKPDTISSAEAEEAQNTILRALNESIGRRSPRLPPEYIGIPFISGPIDDLDGAKAKTAAVKLARAVVALETRLAEVEAERVDDVRFGHEVADGLAGRIEAIRAERDALRTRVTELEGVLAAETGDAEPPPGWERDPHPESQPTCWLLCESGCIVAEVNRDGPYQYEWRAAQGRYRGEARDPFAACHAAEAALAEHPATEEDPG